MANEKEKIIKESPVEKYVVERLQKLEQENAELKGQLESKSAWCNELKNAIIKGTKYLSYTTEEDVNLTELRFDGSFVQLERADKLDKLQGIVELIDLGNKLCE